MHRNQINNKVYVGITGMAPEKRWQNGRGYSYNTHFSNAIKKYGWDHFDHIILEENLTQDEAKQKEIEYIQYYNATNPQNGYNVSPGGDGQLKPVYQYDRFTGRFLKQWKGTIEIEKELNIPNPDISAVCLGKVKTSHNFYFSYVDYGPQLPHDIYNWINTNDWHVMVAQYGLDGKFINVYNTKAEAARYLGKEGQSINFSNKTSLGFIWKQVDDIQEYDHDLTPDELECYRRNKPSEKRVFQYDMDGNYLRSFCSTCEAGEKLNIKPNNIAAACRGITKSYKGCLWRYATEMQEGERIPIDQINKLRIHARSKGINQYGLNGNYIKHFDCITTAANELGLSTNNISHVCMRKNKSTGGFIFRYDDDSLTEDDIKWVNKHNRKRSVIQYNTFGDFIAQYESIAEASRKTGINQSMIFSCCNNEGKSHNGFKWKYAN